LIGNVAGQPYNIVLKEGPSIPAEKRQVVLHKVKTQIKKKRAAHEQNKGEYNRAGSMPSPTIKKKNSRRKQVDKTIWGKTKRGLYNGWLMDNRGK